MKYLALAAALFAPFTGSVDACTDFLISSSNGAQVNGRSMEFGVDLNSSLVVHPAGEKKQSAAPNKRPGLQWTSRFGYVGANALGLDITVDGLNDQGLSVGMLWLPGSEYEHVAPEQSERALLLNDLADWVLGNFSNVGEVREALSSILVWGEEVQQLHNMIPPVHLSVHDASGNSLVVEFINGQKLIFDNSIHVLTNAPTFDWQVTNLSNYVNLKALNASAMNFNGLVVNPTGQGSGLHGIPGDWTPPSRFVRTALVKQFLETPQDATTAVNEAFHLLNMVDIPLGSIRQANGKTTTDELTQWIVVKDLTNKVVYYRTYSNQSIRKVDLSQLHLAAGSKQASIPMNDDRAYFDVTSSLR